jgi:hypothetical protein
MKLSKILNFTLMGVSIALGGCVHQEPQYTWTKASMNTEEREYLVADGACKAEAYKAAPMAPAYESNCMDMKAGFARGACIRGDLERSKSMVQVRDQIYQGCMMGKGWERQQIN